MATSSFLKDVRLKSKKQAQNLIRALETSQAKPEKQVVFSRPVSDMSPDEIRKTFSPKGKVQ